MDLVLNPALLSISKASFEAAHFEHTGWSHPNGFCLINFIQKFTDTWADNVSFTPRPLTRIGGPTKNANGGVYYFIIKFAPLTCRPHSTDPTRWRVSALHLTCELTAVAGAALLVTHVHWEYSSNGRNEEHVIPCFCHSCKTRGLLL